MFHHEDLNAPAWQPPGPAILFCPADRPERYAKAADRADAVILDLEDAVTAAARPAAREALLATPLDPARTIVRVNAFGTHDFAQDIETLRRSPYRVIMLAKTESAHQLDKVAQVDGLQVIALIETPLGAVNVNEIAAHPRCIGIMWGAEDLVAAMGGRSSRFPDGTYRDVARHVRSCVRLAAAAHGKFALDSVYIDIGDTDGLTAEALDAVALGYAATVCIHPSQAAVIRAAYRPTDDEIDWAREVLAAEAGNNGVYQVRGQMIDAPLLAQARAIVARLD
ncbi:Citrate (Pro-3S)-lyase OS=Tsukamurella paurometabola (strain ATCC 8368 / DSM / CCUG 35730 /CIP 100753 / JCM 10117 / KCTC 9821 / NBRC 16120 / NCIMB 702349/ NCTC 13040) OX=521096 GN=Tpau_3317 PE=4 SV=1 [Tsukamurella paurometabola]|uniref:Citrate (Pro-3S)-lyase n=1 Tax=Tsukamurella paurometabola (strain ATCC 8368 / DSM 20162 / CCUG 35730 / CIP 100753 / JCM 10117 / KCTC 9821 / NBRC 16120 / NCIMB 702349 / NCTC 13040) TaxID=521096 RepID=D5UWA3_TSUPD|nr:CoA ester lyase [Tsukamurella paurometabola]ADG79902.1 Citrate (pro-3S)-lyase [Tsukamurella paurometabola DSM 20162]SUP37590.1 Citrate lyase subunit beta-like protein [Tsukamurella paurometabola]